MSDRRAAALLCLVLASACGPAAPSPRSAADTEPEEGAPPEPEHWAIALRLQEGTPSEDETPHTEVSLVRIDPDGVRTVVALRDEVGACYPEPARDGALIAARCWWAGQGARWVVRREVGAIVAYRVPEAAPSEPEELGRVEVPEDAELDLVR